MELIEKYVTPQREKELIQFIRSKMDGTLGLPGQGRSRILRYGWDYEGKKWVADIPDEFNRPGMDSVTINEYVPGRGIDKHVDSRVFADCIEILSLGSDAEIIFEKSMEKPVSFNLYARSLFRMNGEMRYSWTHRVPPVRHKRWSIVFRRKL